MLLFAIVSRDEVSGATVMCFMDSILRREILCCIQTSRLSMSSAPDKARRNKGPASRDPTCGSKSCSTENFRTLAATSDQSTFSPEQPADKMGLAQQKKYAILPNGSRLRQGLSKY